MVTVINVRVDCRGLYDPWAIVLLRRHLDRMREGEILEMISDDPGAVSDVQAWANLTGHHLLETHCRDNEYSFYIQKKSKESAMAEYQIAKTLDCTGLLCPMPVVKTNKAMKEIQVGEVLEMIATDPGSMPDMEAWARQTQHELLEAIDEGNSKFRFIIKKTH